MARNLCTQLNIALCDLAIQMPGWDNAVLNMINHFGNHTETMSILLDFLSILPEELLYNTKIRLEVNDCLIFRRPNLKRGSKVY